MARIRWKYRHLYPACVRDPTAYARDISLETLDPRILKLKWSHYKLLCRACARLRLPAEDVLDLAAVLFSQAGRRYGQRDEAASGDRDGGFVG